MVEITAIDVTRRDVRHLPLGVGHGQDRSVIAHPGDPRALPRERSGDADDLTLARRRIVGIGRGLAIHPEIDRCVLDDSVGFGGHHETVLGQADEHTLAAPPQRKVHVGWNVSRADADGHRSLELGDRAANRLVEHVTVGEVAGHQGRDDLCICRDLARDPEALGRDQIGEVVDVAVERRRHVRARLVAQLVAVDRMGIGFGDDAHRGPPGVPQDGRLCLFVHQGHPQERIGRDGGSHGAGVVAEFADLCCGFVDQGQVSLGCTYGPVSEQRVGETGLDQCTDSIGVEIEAMVTDEHVETSAVTTANLQPVERAQGLLDAEERRHRRTGRVRTDERRHLACGSQTVALDRPGTILGSDQRGIDRLQVGDTFALDVEVFLDVEQGRVDLRKPCLDPGNERGVEEHRRQTGFPAEKEVDLDELAGCSGQRPGLDLRRRRNQRGSRSEALQQLCATRGFAPCPATDDCDDPAHVVMAPLACARLVRSTTRSAPGRSC